MELFYPVCRRINQIANEEQIQENGNQFTFLQPHIFFQIKMNRIKCTCEVFSILFQNCIFASSVDAVDGSMVKTEHI